MPPVKEDAALNLTAKLGNTLDAFHSSKYGQYASGPTAALAGVNVLSPLSAKTLIPKLDRISANTSTAATPDMHFRFLFILLPPFYNIKKFVYIFTKIYNVSVMLLLGNMHF